VASDLLFAGVFSATDRILWYQKGNPHQRIAETTIALDASLHSTAKLSNGKLSNGKLSNGKLPTAREPLSRFTNFPMGDWLNEPIAPNPWAIAGPYFLAS
jgi:hypothetical protein